jgi:hypothetical protein
VRRAITLLRARQRPRSTLLGLVGALLGVCAVASAANVVIGDAAQHAALTCRGERATIVGTAGDDRLVGTRRADVIYAGAGDDVVLGGGGADLICDKAGDDRVDGGAGDDEIGGGEGADRLEGGAGDDWLAGRPGADELSGGGGDDRLVGERGDDVLRGDAGDDRLGGGPGRDRCSGGPGADVVRCESGRGPDGPPPPAPSDPPPPPPSDPPPQAPTDQPPVAAGDVATLDEDAGAQAIPVLANDTDADGGPVSIASVTQPAHGTVQITGGGGLTYAPAADYCNGPATDDFSYALAPGGSSATVAVTVECVNDAPLVAASAGVTAYTENAAATPVDADVVAVDSDSAFASGATLQIAGGFQPGDELVFTDQSGITGTYDSGTGVLTLTGTALIGDYQAALRSVGFRHTGDDPAATRTVTFSVSDGAAASTPAAKGIEVTPVNDPPSVVTTGAALSYTEGDGPVPVDAAVAVSDPESAPMSGATVQITSNFSSAEDELAFTDQAGITGSYDDMTGTLTLSGAAGAAAYETALRSVTYENSSSNPSTATRTVSFRVTDAGLAASNVATRDMSLTGAPDVPVVTTSAGSSSYTEGGSEVPLDSHLLVSDADDVNLEGATVRISSGFQAGDELVFVNQLGISGLYNTGTGVLTLTGTASVSDYQAALRSVDYRHSGDNPQGSKTVELVVTDGDAGSAPATRSIQVTPVNDAPQIATTGAALAYSEGDGAVAVDGGLSVVDFDSPQLDGATVQITSGFAPAQDELGFVDQGGITGSYDDTTGTLTLSGAASVSNYELALRSVTYENSSDNPTAATRTVTFQVTDSELATGTPDTRDIGVAGANDAPVVSTTAAPLAYTEGEPSTPLDPGVVVSDVDDANLEGATVRISSGFQLGDDLVFVNQVGISGVYNTGTGVLTLSGTASVTDYQTALRSIGFQSTNVAPVTTKTVEFKADDGDLDSNAATRQIEVTPVNSPPQVGAGGTLDYTENDPATAVSSGLVVTEPEGEGLSGGSVSITALYQAGQDSLGWTDNDPADNITLDALNSSSRTIVLTGMDTAAHYQAALRAVTYENDSESPETAARTVAFSASDVLGLTDIGTDTIAVTSVDDLPVAVNDSATVDEDASATEIPVRANDTDVDGGPMTVWSASDPANGTVELTGGSPGARTGLTYRPDPDYCNDPPGTTVDTFSYSLNGYDSADVSVTVTCGDDAPVADDETFNGDDSAIGNTAMVVNDPDDGVPSLAGPKTTVSGDILAGDSDIDGPGPLTVTAGTFATNDGGFVTIEPDGDFAFEPAATSCTDTSDFFDYTVASAGAPGVTDTGRVTIALAGCVWYVSNSAAGNSGTSSAPFDTLAQAETASGANHTVFVFDGDNTSTGYDTGYALNAGERLIGEHAGLVIDPDGFGPLTPDTLQAANPGAHPTLSANGEDVVQLDDGNEVHGFVLDPAGAGGGIAGGAGDESGTITGVNVVDDALQPGTQPGIELDGTAGTFHFADITVQNGGSPAATGIRLNNAGNVNFVSPGRVAIATTGAKALDATNTHMSSVFDDIVVTGSSSGGVSLSGTTGITLLGDDFGTDLSLTTSGATPALRLSNAGDVAAGPAGTENVAATGGPAVDVTNTGAAIIQLDDVDATNSPTDGINLDNAGTFSAESGDITGAGGIAFDLNGGSGNVSYAGNLNNGSGPTAVEITNRSGGSVTLSGRIDDTADAGGGISMSGNSGGTVTFSGTTKKLDTGASPGFSSTGTGSTVNFTGGGLDIDTTTAPGFTATGGGTVTVQGPGNSIASTGATALNVTGTAIGASDLTFQSITSGNADAAPDPANGIVLGNTGSSGNLAVTGNGGTCTSPATCSGGVIQSTTGDGISLTSTRDVALDSMLILNTGRHGIFGTGVTNLTLDNMRIGGSGDAGGENGLHFGTPSTNNLLGTATITNSVITNSHQHQLAVENVSGTLTMNVTDAEFTVNDSLEGGDGILYRAGGTADMTLDVGETVLDGCLFQNLNGDGIQALTEGTGPAGNTSEVTLNVDGCTFDTLGGGGQGAVGIRAVNNTRGSFDIRNNVITNIQFAGTASAVLDDSEVTGTLENNTITGTGMEGILMVVEGGPSSLSPVLRTLIKGNTLSEQRDIRALRVSARDGTGGDAHVRLEENTISAPLDVGFGGGDGAVLRAEDGMSICLDIRDNDNDTLNNSSAGTNEAGGSGLVGYRLSDPGGGSFGLEGFATGGSLPAFLSGEHNTGSVVVPDNPLVSGNCNTP